MTPDISYDFTTLQGRAFYYFCYGAAVSEVEIDTRTGEWWLQGRGHRARRRPSINPAIDRGQIEGAYIQGMGWLTMEECVWERQRQAADQRPEHLQDPGGRRRARALQGQPVRRAERQAHALPQQGRGRAAADAGAVGLLRPARRGERVSAGTRAGGSGRARHARAHPAGLRAGEGCARLIAGLVLAFGQRVELEASALVPQPGVGVGDLAQALRNRVGRRLAHGAFDLGHHLRAHDAARAASGWTDVAPAIHLHLQRADGVQQRRQAALVDPVRR